MQFLVSFSFAPGADPAAIEAARAPSAKVLWQLHLAGIVREMYSRNDNQGVVFMAEAPDPVTLRDALSQLPFLRQGLLTGEALALVPLPDLALAFTG